ncbi:hypothetical protein BDQ94DRAFT_52421 [Aspergillus welwitschiae]|uniref:Integral membrane protein n=1 Tax=Aspergillus welwitschiae TaxID=1341132 RepID=A0A3F3PYQ6_9EURO|nr:hypothetical protein BDQ94DRAFT_52421 [Aspergillus welwitschiae]RDH31862.1 hypothetical protein BDQ94DRAFT_52421 [Aspergillus welwitschiae]
MFTGEMGCWLVIFMTHLYQQYIAPRLSNNSSPLLAGGYHPVNNTEGLDEEEDYTIRGPEASDDVTKPATLADGRIHLRGYRIFLLAAPACCDIAGTTLMNVGLLFVAASVYQMTRGALVLFVGLFSVLFLHRKLHLYHWLALFIVVLGVALVGLAGALFADNQGHDVTQGSAATVMNHAIREIQATTRSPEALKAVVGVLLIAAAQIFTASQFVLEEWILENYEMDPLQVVGWEGIFGFSVTVIGSIILYLTIGRTEAGRYGYFDAKEGWSQVFNNRAIAMSSFLIMISIGGFNFFGLSVTRTVSATSRSTIDTCRTLFIWLVSLALGWETFKWLQVVGFALLVYGTFLFNDIVRPPLKACLPSSRRDREILLPEEPIEHM